MRKNIFSLLLLILTGCTQDRVVEPQKGNMQFSFSLKGNSGSPIQSGATSVVLNIEKANGDIVENNTKIPFYNLGGGYVSANLQLPIGDYKITQFIVLNAESEVVFATPLQGSKLTTAVTTTLPIYFSVIEKNNMLLTPQVLDVNAQNPPEAFGYANLAFEIADKKVKVKRVVYSDFFIDASHPFVTTMDFEYSQGKVQTVKWDFSSFRSGVEQRFYSPNGDLASLASSEFKGIKWSLSYEYKNGIRYKIESKRNDTIQSATTFIEYKGSKPAHVNNLNGVYGVYGNYSYGKPVDYSYSTALTFDAVGNLTSQRNTGFLGFPDDVEERTTQYTTEINPLRELIETPIPQVFDFYDNLAFYYSANLPSSIEGINYPYVDPVYNQVTFQYEKDTRGRIILVKAFGPANKPSSENLRYTLTISYY